MNAWCPDIRPPYNPHSQTPAPEQRPSDIAAPKDVTLPRLPGRIYAFISPLLFSILTE